MQKIYIAFAAFFCVAMFYSHTQFSSVPPTGVTGATGAYCTNCHSSFALNSGGGGVSVTGLPSGGFNAGQVYNFSLTISHGTADRRRWGFSISAVNAQGQSVGTFSTTNANAGQNGSELSHNNAVATAAAATYTYNNLTWTAPTNPTANDANVTFYYVGNAANQANGNQGDYIYSGSSAVTLPIQLQSFTAKAQPAYKTVLQWVSASEVNAAKFQVQKSDDNQYFVSIADVAAKGAQTPYVFTDVSVSYFNKPVFYRLKMVDKDGSAKYSAVVTVTHNKAGNLVENIFPSMAVRGSKVTVRLVTEQTQKIELSYVNVMGRVLQKQTVQSNVGTNNFPINVPNSTTPGIHYIRVVGEGWSQTVPIIVQ
ncbi:MAG: hypothetical protein EAZ47_05940 [Bacteroidetes bacterium]|nr:MAG: hypothetical protein EAY72_06525 [Bacteroidota bacterium]TAE67635.1 MAG: hypothetical protein EAY68_05240 [Bacteroidota bacterium]TAF93647.1 MAG: hypothetical protein EAZ47_05940 [Bacteroidota bacterium]